MYKIKNIINPYTKLSELIIEHLDIIIALEHLNIPLGFGDQTLLQIAKKYNLNMDAFVSIIKVFCGIEPNAWILDKEAVPDLLTFLRLSHDSFKRKQIPELKEQIALFSKVIPPNQGQMLIFFFDGYIREVAEHFMYEDEVVFPYINNMLSGSASKDFAIWEFEKNHTNIEDKLLDLKNILIKHLSEDIQSDYRKQILWSLVKLERDLIFHTHIEDQILVPSVKNIENKLKSN